MITNSKLSSFFTSYFSSSVSLDLDEIIKTPVDIDDDDLSYDMNRVDLPNFKDYIKTETRQDKIYDTIYKDGIIVTRYNSKTYHNEPKSIKISLVPHLSSSMKIDAIPSSDFLDVSNPSYEDQAQMLNSYNITSYTGLIYTNSLQSYYKSEHDKLSYNSNYICSLYSSTIEMIQGYERSISYFCAYIESTLLHLNGERIYDIFNTFIHSENIPLRIDVETVNSKSKFVWRTDSSILYDDLRKKNHTIYAYNVVCDDELDKIAYIIYTYSYSYSYLSYLHNFQPLSFLKDIDKQYKTVYFSYLNAELAEWNQIQDVEDPKNITIDYNDPSKYEDNYLRKWKTKTSRATIDDLEKSLEKIRKGYDKLALLLNDLIVKFPELCQNEIKKLKDEKH